MIFDTGRDEIDNYFIAAIETILDRRQYCFKYYPRQPEPKGIIVLIKNSYVTKELEYDIRNIAMLLGVQKEAFFWLHPILDGVNLNNLAIMR
jgi:hypothetical protein